MNEEYNPENISKNNEDIYIEINNPNVCIICLEILDNDIIDACNNCNIKCHKICLLKWYKSNRKQICPICLKTKKFYRNKKIKKLLKKNINEEEIHIINSINIANDEIDDGDEIYVENNDIIQENGDINNIEQLIINRDLMYNLRFRNLYMHICSSNNISVYLILGFVTIYIYSSFY